MLQLTEYQCTSGNLHLFAEKAVIDTINELNLPQSLLCGSIAQVDDRLQEGHFTFFNQNYRLFFYLYKEGTNIMIRSVTRVDFLSRGRIIEKVNLIKKSPPLPSLVATGPLTFIRSLYCGESRFDVELPSSLQHKLRRLGSFGFGESEMCSLFASLLPFLSEGHFNVYTQNHYTYMPFSVSGRKLQVLDIIRSDFHSNGIHTVFVPNR